MFQDCNKPARSIGGSNTNLAFAGNGSTLVAGAIATGIGGLTQNGGGTLILAGANTYSGTTAINTGTLQIGNGGASGTLGSGNVSNSGVLTFNRSDAALVYGGVISGSGGVTQTGTGTTTLAGANTYNGPTTINGGMLKLDFSVGGAPTANIVNNSANNSTLVLNGATLAVNSGAAAVAYGQQFNGVMLGSGGSTIADTLNPGATSLALSLGTITRSSGATLNFSVAPNATTNIINVTGAANDASGILGPWATMAIGVGTGGYATVNGSNQTVPYAGASPDVLGNLASLTSSTTNYTTVAVGETLGGPATANTLQYFGSGTIALGTNTLTLNGLIVNGSSPTTITNAAGGSIAIGSNHELVLVAAQNTTISAPITNNIDAGASALTLAGLASSTVTLSGVNTFSGGLTLGFPGTLVIGNASALGTGTFTIAAPATISGNVVTTNPVAVDSDFTIGGNTAFTLGAMTLAASHAITLTNTATSTLGAISGTATAGNTQSLTLNGTGSVTLGGAVGDGANGGKLALSVNTIGVTLLSTANGYSGGTTVNAGVVAATVSGSLGATSGAVLLNANSELAVGGSIGNTVLLGGPGVTLSALGAGAGALTNASTALVTGTNAFTVALRDYSTGAADNLAISGPISGSGKMTIATTGVVPGIALTLTGNSSGTYSGAIQVNPFAQLTLDLSSQPSGVLSSYNDLTLAGGQVSVTTGAGNGNESLGNLTLNRPSSILINGATAGNATLTLGTNWTRNPGSALSIVYGTGTNLVTTGANLPSINGVPVVAGAAIGPLIVTVAGDTEFGRLTLNGGLYAVTQLTGQTKIVDNTLTYSPAVDYFVTGFPFVVLGQNAAMNTLTLSLNGFGKSLDLAAHTLTLTQGALLYNSNQAFTFKDTLGGGQLGASNAELIVHTAPAAAGNFIISLPISGGSGSLTKTGALALILGGASTYTGDTVFNGTLQIGSGALGSLGNTNIIDNGTLVFGRTNAMTFPNLIGGPGGVTQSAGGGTTLLTNANTYLGPTTISNGTLIVGNGGTTGTLGSGNVVNATGLMFDRSDAALTVGGVISGAGAVTQTGSGTTTLTGTNTYLGATNVNFGTLILLGNNTAASGATTIAAGAILQLGNGGSTGGIAATSTITDNGSLIFNRSDAGSSYLAITGVGSVSRNGAGGVTTLTGVNTYTGATNVNAGTLILTNTSTGITATTIAPGATLQIGGAAGAMAAASTIADNGTLAFARTAGLTFANAIAGSGGVNQFGSATVSLTGANTYGGTTAIAAGSTLQIGNAGVTGTLGAGNVADNGALLFNRTDNALTYAGIISGAGTVTQSGTGSATLSGPSTYTGSTAITAGTLIVSSLNKVAGGAASSSLGAPTTVANGTISIGSAAVAGMLSYTGTGETTDRAINLAGTTGGATLDSSGAGALNFTSNFTATGAGLSKTLTLTGNYIGSANVISGALVNNLTGTNLTALLKSGPGTWSIAPAAAGNVSTFTGNLTINGGTLLLDDTAANVTSAIIPSSNALTLGGGTLAIKGSGSATFGQTLGALALTASTGSGIAVNPTNIGFATSLTTGTLTRNAGATLNVDLTGATNGSLTIGAATVALLPYVAVTDNGGVGFGATNVGVVSRALVTGPLSTTNANNTTGDYSLAVAATTFQFASNAATAANSLVISATGGASTFDFNNATFTIAQNAFLVANDGSSPLTIQNGTIAKGGAGAEFIVNQLGASPTTFSTTFAAGITSFTKGGAGPVILTGASLTSLGATAAINLDAGNLTFLETTPTRTSAKVIAGPGNLIVTPFSGTTILTLTGANTYTGSTTLSTGTTLQIGDNIVTTAALSGTSSVLINSGATLAFNNKTGGTSTMLGNISGSGALTQNNAGSTAILTGNNSAFSGSVTINGGTLQIGNSGNTGTLGSGNVLDNAALTFKRSDNGLAYAGNISGTGAVTNVSGTTTLTGANSYQGITTITAGTLQIGNGGSSGTLGTGNTTNSAGANLVFNRSDNALSYGGVISSTGTVNQIGSGTTTLTGINTFTGATNVAAGTLILAASDTGATPTSIAAGATLQLGNGGTTGGMAAGSTVVDNGSLIYNRTDTPGPTYSGIISGAGTISQNGSGTTTLTAANTFGGTIAINAGTLSIGAGAGAGTIANVSAISVANSAGLVFNNTGSNTVFASLSGSGSMTLTNGTIILTGNNSAFSGQQTINGGTLQIGNGPTGTLGTGNLLDNGTLVFKRTDNNLAYAGNISGSGAVTASAGITTLTGTNSYGGITTIAAGATLQIGNGGTTGTLAGSSVANAGFLVFNRSDNLLTYGNGISGAGFVTQAGPGTTTLTGVNAYTGPTNINAGILQIGNGGALGATGVTVAAGGTFATALNTSSGTVAGGSTLSLASGATLNMQDAGYNTLAFSGPLVGLNLVDGAVNGATLKFDLGTAPAQNDQLTLAGAGAFSGTVNFNFAALGGSLTNGVYTLVTATGGGLNSGFTINNATPSLLGHTLTVTSPDANDIIVTIATGTATPAPALAFTTANNLRALVGANVPIAGNVTNPSSGGAAAAFSNASLSDNGGNLTVSGFSPSGTFSVAVDGTQAFTASIAAGAMAGAKTYSVLATDGANPVSATQNLAVVDQRTFTSPATVDFGNVLLGSSLNSGALAITTSTGDHATTANSTLGAYAGGNINGLTATGSAALADGTVGTINRMIGGTLSGSSGTLNGTFNMNATDEFLNAVNSAANVSYTVHAFDAAVLTPSFGGGNATLMNASGANRASATVSNNTTVTYQSSGNGTSTSGFSVGAFSTTSIAPGSHADFPVSFDSTNRIAGTLYDVVKFTARNDATISGSATGDLNSQAQVLVSTTVVQVAPQGFNNTFSAYLLPGQTHTDLSSYSTGNAVGHTASIPYVNYSVASKFDNTTNSNGNLNFTWVSPANASGPPAYVAALGSDVLDVSGIDGQLFVLQMSYDPSKFSAAIQPSAIELVSYNGTAWVGATVSDHGSNLAGFQGNESFNTFETNGLAAYQVAHPGATEGDFLAANLGAYGVDTTTDQAWAVVNHNSEFAVVPEPSTLALMAFGALAGFGLWRRKKRVVG